MVAARYGWSFDYIMDGVAWINIRMMLADSIKTAKNSKKEDEPTEMSDDEMLAMNEE